MQQAAPADWGSAPASTGGWAGGVPGALPFYTAVQGRTGAFGDTGHTFGILEREQPMHSGKMLP